MHDTIELILGYLRGVWRYRWYVFAVTWPVAIGGWLFVSQMPNEYEASARVYVDTRSILRPLLTGLAVQLDERAEIEMMTKTILSRPNLEKIARMSDLDLTAKTNDAMDELITRLNGKIRFETERRAENLYLIRYVDSDSKVAKQVVQSIVTVFVENTLGDKRKDSDNAQRFLEQQITEYETRLRESEDRLTQFKQRYLGVLPNQSGGHYQKLQTANEELRNVQLLLREALQRRDELKRQLDDVAEDASDSLIPSMPGGGDTVFDARIQGLEAKLDELLLRYTERHPDVVAIRSTIETLKKQKDEASAKTPQQKQDLLAGTNPVYQQLKLALGEAEANVASLSVREKEYQSRMKQLEKQVNTVPEVEAEMTRLDRDYEINKRNYDLLVARRESAKLGEQAEQTGENVKFRVVDPPFVKPDPVAPNRPVLVSIVFLVALGIGFVYPLFLSQIKPVFDSVKRLRDYTGLPVFGSVTMLRTPKQITRKRIEFLSYVVVGSFYVVTYLGVLFWSASSFSLRSFM